MARKSTLGGKPAVMTPVSPTKMTEGDVHGGGSKSGQFPGHRQHIGEPEAGGGFDEVDINGPTDGSRGVDPALAGKYVETSKSNAQGAAPGKTQVIHPNFPVRAAAGGTKGPEGGQYPGIPVPIHYSDRFDGLDDTRNSLAGVTRGPQERESEVGNVRGGQYPGIPQVVEGLAGKSSAPVRDVLGIESNEGDELNLRDVPEDDQNLGGRHVETDKF